MGIFDCASLAPPLLSSIELFTQRIEAADVGVIAVLIVLEGVLSIDNALVLGLLAKRLPKHQQKKALTYGLVGAFVFRLIAIFTATLLLKLPVMKLLGGVYLIYVAAKHFLFEFKDPTKEHVKIGTDGHPVLHDSKTGEQIPESEQEQEIASRSPFHVSPAMSTTATVAAVAMFWPTVAVIELTDIAFAIDSILAAIAFIPPATQTPNPKLWVVVAGGMLGVILMRFAAVIFIRLLERFPRFEVSAYLLVIVIGLKLSLDWLVNSYLHPRPADWPINKPYHGPLDFHNFTSAAFVAFWLLMTVCFAIGFLPQHDRSGNGKIS
jgi:YkoY family integral membrane protein